MKMLLSKHFLNCAIVDDQLDEVYTRELPAEDVLEDQREMMIDALCVWFDEKITFLDDDLRNDVVNDLQKRLEVLDINILQQYYNDHIG